MDGKQIGYQVRQLLQEGSTSTFMDSRTTYDFVYEAVLELVNILKLTSAEQTITTTTSTTNYNINANYLCLDVRNDTNEYVLKYYNGVSYYWIPFRDANSIYQSESINDQSIPDSFSIVDKATLIATISSKSTAVGAAAGGECTLTDSTAPFTNVTAGDMIHNTSDGSDGVVTSVTSTSIVKTALFGGTANDWTSGDDYVLVPQTRKQLILSPPSLDAGHIITFKYVSKPDPVYSDYGVYRIPDQYMPAVCKYAAWLYKYRDREPNFGDGWYKYWDMQVRKASMNENRLPNKLSWGVNMKKRSYGNRSMR